ncbi:hypothetical protein DdX_13015 [Ditylenchus destructor]|uniref:Uncharacterized protein n=1 Tax=Ditylenchus destructor TaxID=166010 RepID=A0AAD4MV74_9BILA|nr:hypothetical protein DdX_13015 [Ditylenchus destructor]
MGRDSEKRMHSVPHHQFHKFSMPLRPSLRLSFALFLFIFVDPIRSLALTNHQQHQQRRSSTLEEIVQRRMTRAFPYSGVSSYLRMTQPASSAQINPHVIFSPSAHTFSNSLAHWRRTDGSKAQERVLFVDKTEPEIAELIDLLDNLEAHGVVQMADNDEKISLDPLVTSRQRRSNGPVLKRYACRFKFCRIFDA